MGCQVSWSQFWELTHILDWNGPGGKDEQLVGSVWTSTGVRDQASWTLYLNLEVSTSTPLLLPTQLPTLLLRNWRLNQTHTDSQPLPNVARQQKRDVKVKFACSGCTVLTQFKGLQGHSRWGHWEHPSVDWIVIALYLAHIFKDFPRELPFSYSNMKPIVNHVSIHRCFTHSWLVCSWTPLQSFSQKCNGQIYMNVIYGLSFVLGDHIRVIRQHLLHLFSKWARNCYHALRVVQ